jgi:diguanylate cyclase (GGDEF)-like protein
MRTSLEAHANLNTSPLFPILHHAFEGIALVELGTGNILYLNPTLSRWLGNSPGGVSGSSICRILKTEGPGTLLDSFESAWQGAGSATTLHAHLLPEEQPPLPVSLRVFRLPLEAGPILAVIAWAGDRDSPASHDMKPPHRDSLTGLPDRAFLLSRLSAWMDGQRPGDRHFAILFVDLDNFKQVNDAHGHLVGDRVLSAVAKRLSDCVRDGDHVARYGGDEFVVLLSHVTHQSELEPIISRIRAVLAEPISLPEGDFALSVSIGAALASPEHQRPEDILAVADRAMYASKR